jgi:hypothetical protein
VAADWDLDRGWAEAELVDQDPEAVAEVARAGVAERERAEVCGKRASRAPRLADLEAVAELAAELELAAVLELVEEWV